MDEPRRLRYPAGVLAKDYLRSAFGAGLCLVPLVLVDAAEVMTWILGIVGAVFVVFGLRTVVRHVTTIELCADGVRARGPFARRVAWSGLTAMSLAFYSMRRRRTARDGDPASGGWMELKLRCRGSAIALDSSLEGFEHVVARAASAAAAAGLRVNAATCANLEAMGFADEAVALEEARS